MEKALISEEEADQAIKDWSAQLRERQQAGAQPLTVMEHTALTFILRSRFLDEVKDPDSKKSIERILAQSWKDLTGEPRDPSILLERLPRRVLAKANRVTRAFHAAAFQNASPEDAKKEVGLGRDYVPEWKDGAALLGLLGLAFTKTGSSMMGGALLGYGVVSLTESFFHKNAGHASKSVLATLDKMGWPGRYVAHALRQTTLGHEDYHHTRTYQKDHVTQFESQADREKLEEEVKQLGKKGEELLRTNFGVTLDNGGVFRFLLAAAPAYAAVILAAHLSPAAIAGMLIPAAVYPMGSKILHPYMHMPKAEALQKAGPLMKRFLSTRYVAMISRLHYGHHRGRGGNFNLLFGGDWFLRELKKPAMRDVIKQHYLGTLGMPNAGADPSKGLPGLDPGDLWGGLKA